MKHTFWHLAVVAAGATISAAAQPALPTLSPPDASSPARQAPERDMAEVARQLHTGRHAEAFSSVASMADRGHAGAALLALALLREGPALYGSLWSASPGQLRRWTALAETALRELPAEVLGNDVDEPNRGDQMALTVLPQHANCADRPRGRIGARGR